jgi:dihydrofolate reductase
VFNQISLDGYFVDRDGNMDWAKKPPDDAEWNAFVASNASGGGALVFGRVTYEMMASFWPTPQAAAQMPVVAERMNSAPKVVFSRTLEKAEWRNTRLVKNDLIGEIRRMKQSAKEPDMAILGSGTLVAQLARAGLIDTLQLVFNPIALGGGRTLFEGLEEPRTWKLQGSRAFANGNA